LFRIFRIKSDRSPDVSNPYFDFIKPNQTT
jgi:hypothetical protein